MRRTRLAAVAMTVLVLVACRDASRTPQETVGVYLHGIKGQDPMRSLALLTDEFHLAHGMVFANTADLPDEIVWRLPESSEPGDREFAVERGRLGWLVAPSQMGRAHLMFPRLKEIQLGWLGEQVSGNGAVVRLRAWVEGAASVDLTFRLERRDEAAPWRIGAVDAEPDGSAEARFIAYVISPDIEAVRFVRSEALRRSRALEKSPPSVVLITLDTTRVDHLSAYGYHRETTPQLDRLTEESVVHTRAWSPSPWTLPAHASLFTGLEPAAHGAHARPGAGLTLGSAIRGPYVEVGEVGKLEEGFETLAERLAAHGYRTGAFLGGPWLKPEFGLMQGFEHVDDEISHLGGRRGGVLADRAIAWLAGLEQGAPYFLFANFFDAHWPYRPPPGYDDLPGARDPLEIEPLVGALVDGTRTLDDAEREVMIARYDGELRYQDEQLGRLLDAVRARLDGRRTLIVVTSDHGEAFGEGGRYFHTYWLSPELLRVPLVVRYPEQRGAGTTDSRPIQLTDVLPLIANEVGIAYGDGIDGVLPGERELVFADLFRHRLAIRANAERFDRDLSAAIDWPFMLVRSDRGEADLFRIDSVPEQPASEDGPRMRLSSALDARQVARPRSAGASPVVDEDVGEMLKHLGYLE